MCIPPSQKVITPPEGESADLVTPRKDWGLYAWRLAGNSQPLRSLEKLERAEKTRPGSAGCAGAELEGV